MNLGENKTGLSPIDFKGKHKEAKIVSDINCETKKSQKGVDYETYGFKVEIGGKQWDINFLMRNQLNNLVDLLGQETSQWIGKTIYIDAEQRGNFHNFVFYGDSKVEEETVQ